MDPKPLFIPLCARFFDAFESGDKLTEYRLYGPRWNLKTCYFGRQVILSRGYGKQKRLSAVIDKADVYQLHELYFGIQRTLRETLSIQSGEDHKLIMAMTMRDIVPIVGGQK